jgi:hypothetical protein
MERTRQVLLEMVQRFGAQVHHPLAPLLLAQLGRTLQQLPDFELRRLVLAILESADELRAAYEADERAASGVR